MTAHNHIALLVAALAGIGEYVHFARRRIDELTPQIRISLGGRIIVERILLVIVFVYEDGNLDGIGEEIVGLAVLFAHFLVKEVFDELVNIHQFRSRLSG